jgi:hypothetical protein
MNCKSFLLFTFLLSACTSPKFTLDTDKVTFNELLDNIQNEQNKITTLKAGCRISIDSDDFSGNFFANVYYIKDDSLLLSVTGPFGIQAGTLFLGKERFIFYNQMTNKFYNGTIIDFSNQTFFQFPLKLRELINIFVGKEDLPSMKISEYSIENNLFHVQANNSDENYSIKIDNSTGHIRKLTLKKDNQVMYTREYDTFVKSDGLYFPRKIRMIRPEEKQAVSIYYTNVSLNGNIEPEKFIIKIADYAEQINYNR